MSADQENPDAAPAPVAPGDPATPPPRRRVALSTSAGRSITLPSGVRAQQLSATARNLQLPAPGARRAVVIGAGSFGTAVAVLLARGGLRTTLQTRTPEQAKRLQDDRENRTYLPGVEFPRELRVEPFGTALSRADYVFLGVPSRSVDEVIARLPESGLSSKAALISLAKGLVPPYGTPPTIRLRERFGAERVACIGGPAHAAEMVGEGAGLVAASSDETLASTVADAFIRAGVVCEESSDPVGVELAGAAKNAAALASGATEAQGLNAAGAAAGHIFSEVWRWAESLGARPESMIGLAGTGDLVATALAPQSRNRRAGELLAQGVPAAEIPGRLGQAVEALESVPLLGRALTTAGVQAPVTTALAKLIGGELPLEDWVGIVRTTVPPRGRWRPAMRKTGFWRRIRRRIAGWFRPDAPADANANANANANASALSNAGAEARPTADALANPNALANPSAPADLRSPETRKPPPEPPSVAPPQPLPPPDPQTTSTKGPVADPAPPGPNGHVPSPDAKENGPEVIAND